MAISSRLSRLVLALAGEEGRELEEWTVRAKSALLRDVFDIELSLTPAAPSAIGAMDRGSQSRISTRPKV